MVHQFLIVFAVVAVSSGFALRVYNPSNALDYWQSFKGVFGKTYENANVEASHLDAFVGNLNAIEEHNRLYAAGKVSFSLGWNEYSDLTNDQHQETLMGFKQPQLHLSCNLSSTDFSSSGIPYAIDWRELGAVTSVKNQGHCGSCWAFSATGALEGQHFRKTQQLISLSEQNLVDCDHLEGSKGCHGGHITSAFKYVKENKGIDTEKSYPYRAQNGQCRYNPKNVGANATGLVSFSSEDKLKDAVALIGPISVGIDARFSFRLYKHGVYYEPKCSNERLDHAVLVVGYGTDEKGGDYWMVKNSWGTSWGDHGYIKMSRNRKNNCGIASAATYPLA